MSGCVKGWIFSGEMDNAMRFNYKFTIIKGYQFDVGHPFKEYINKMYELRLQYTSHSQGCVAGEEIQ